MMKHLTDNMETLAAYIGNTLADHEKQQIEEHLADCGTSAGNSLRLPTKSSKLKKCSNVSR